MRLGGPQLRRGRSSSRRPHRHCSVAAVARSSRLKVLLTDELRHRTATSASEQTNYGVKRHERSVLTADPGSAACTHRRDARRAGSLRCSRGTERRRGGESGATSSAASCVALIVATGGGTAAAYAYLHPRAVTNKGSARCYSEPVYVRGSNFPGTTIAQATATGNLGSVQDALDTCAALWQIGLLRLGSPVSGPADSQEQQLPGARTGRLHAANGGRRRVSRARRCLRSAGSRTGIAARYPGRRTGCHASATAGPAGSSP